MMGIWANHSGDFLSIVGWFLIATTAIPFTFWPLASAKLIGDFHGLAEAQLNEGRDLPVTVDWRSLLGRTLKDTQGFDTVSLQKVLPGIPGLT